MRLFFPVSLNLAGRTCVVIGAADDREAIEKEAALREAGADVRWIQDVITLVETPGRLEQCVADAFFVISTPQDAALSAALRQLADKHRFLLCCIDQPKYGFVSMAAIAKAGPIRIAISTAGLAPRIGKILKNALQHAMDAKFVRFVEHLAGERERVAREHPAPEESPIRREAMIELADGFKADVSFTYPEWFTSPEQFDDISAASAIHKLLQERGWRVAVAESCTGGRIAAALTTVPGSSKSFVGGIVAYDNEVKIAELGVPPEILAQAGAVSEETVLAMAEGARISLHADIAIATTGIAGPDGGTPEKPVGLVWFGLSAALPIAASFRQAQVKNSPKPQAVSQVAVEKWERIQGGSITRRVEFRGDRAAIQSRATTYALGLLWNHIARVLR